MGAKGFEEKLTDFIKQNLTDLVSDEIREALKDAHHYKKECERLNETLSKHHALDNRNRKCLEREKESEKMLEAAQVMKAESDLREAALNASQRVLNVERESAALLVENMRSVVREVFTKKADTGNDTDKPVDGFVPGHDNSQHQIHGGIDSNFYNSQLGRPYQSS